MTYAELFRRQQELVGTTVAVTGRAFFLSRCPPPQAGGECSLNGYLADPGRNDLLESDVPGAIQLAEGGRLLSCSESAAIDRACPGWQQAGQFRIVAVVERQVLGGRETQYIDLDVREKRLT